MKSRLIKAARLTVVTGLLLGGTVLGLICYGNRDMPAPKQADYQASYQRSVAWLKANEARVLRDNNSALWWLVSTAAERTNDAYLKGLVRKSLAHAYGNAMPSPAWKRLVDPSAEVEIDWPSLRPFEGYQRFFYHAVTCQPVLLDDGIDTNDFLQSDMCHPLATQVFVKDQGCSTHQLMGVKLFQRARCPTQVDLNRLQSSLVDDIHEEMRWDNVLMKDAYVQRVLMLYWVGGVNHVKPAWMHRVLSAQQPDGGWIGMRHVPELPDWLQAWRLKSSPPPTTFHATAQGLLLSALAMNQAPR